jgi:beta-fructofuranosidase
MTDHRPLAHLRPETGWTNDPIGPLWWHDRTHLFHQYNPHAGAWDRPHWGHLVTEDLVHWHRRPIALSPGPGGADADGCYSGCVVIDGEQAVMVYTGVRGPLGPDEEQTTCLARSTDPLLDRWVKEPTNPVTVPPEHLDLIGFRDPFVWREDGRWWQLVGAGIRGIGGAALLFSSDDLLDWTEEGAMLTAEELGPPSTVGAMWECPALFRSGDDDVLLLNVHDGVNTDHPIAVVGERTGTRFLPRRVQRLDLGPELYAPCLHTDQRGRVMVWGWSMEATSFETQREAGWAGVLSWPRELTVRDDEVHVAPLPETRGLRARQLRVDLERRDNGVYRASAPLPDAFELEALLGPGSDRHEVRVRCDPTHREYTAIVIDRAAGEVWLDRSRSSVDVTTRGGRVGGSFRTIGRPVRPSDRTDGGTPPAAPQQDGGPDEAADPDAGTPLPVRIVVDRSLLEVFIAERVSLTARIYPALPDSLGLEVVTTDLEDVLELGVWELGSIWADADVG